MVLYLLPDPKPSLHSKSGGVSSSPKEPFLKHRQRNLHCTPAGRTPSESAVPEPLPGTLAQGGAPALTAEEPCPLGGHRNIINLAEPTLSGHYPLLHQ